MLYACGSSFCKIWTERWRFMCWWPKRWSISSIIVLVARLGWSSIDFELSGSWTRRKLKRSKRMSQLWKKTQGRSTWDLTGCNWHQAIKICTSLGPSLLGRGSLTNKSTKTTPLEHPSLKYQRRPQGTSSLPSHFRPRAIDQPTMDSERRLKVRRIVSKMASSYLREQNLYSQLFQALHWAQ